jgi:peptide deformylase
MAIRPLVLADNPILRRKAKKVARIDKSIQTLIADMVETMHAADGLGLAAPQVGVPLRVIVVQIPDNMEDEPQHGKLFVLVNPEIIKSSGETLIDEGCLSVPGYVGETKRATTITVKGLNRAGKEVRLKAEGLLARAFQHEVDHVNGLLFVDRLTSPDTLREVTHEEEPGEFAAAELMES